MVETCTYVRHSKYGLHNSPVSVLIRSTCAWCDRYKITEVCADCYEGVTNSGLPMECGVCKKRMTPEQKLVHWYGSETYEEDQVVVRDRCL